MQLTHSPLIYCWAVFQEEIHYFTSFHHRQWCHWLAAKCMPCGNSSRKKTGIPCGSKSPAFMPNIQQIFYAMLNFVVFVFYNSRNIGKLRAEINILFHAFIVTCQTSMPHDSQHSHTNTLRCTQTYENSHYVIYPVSHSVTSTNL